MKQIHKDSIDAILFHYSSYRETSIKGRWTKYDQVSNYFKKFSKSDKIYISTLGNSFEGRPIELIKIGTGPTKVLMWSQMHGDESTSTRALLDLLNFLMSSDDNDKIRSKILSSISFHIILMLNPDGAERFSRRNTQLIDINRDAVLQQSPEAQILYKAKNNIQPSFAFNLHDQSSGYSVGRDYKSSTISLLAPPVNYQNQITENVKTSMQLILSIKEYLDDVIPGHVARYDDEFEPRAFGDNFAKDGVPTILIEAGGWKNDFNREYVRKIYFSALLKALLTLADNSYKNFDINNYLLIPENEERLFDLLLRNITIYESGKNYTVDIAIKHEVKCDQKKGELYTVGIISDIGDLSTFHGYEDLDLNGHKLERPKIAEKRDEEIFDLLLKGIGFIKDPSKNDFKWTSDPINYCTDAQLQTELEIDHSANFFLRDEKSIKFAVINGYLIDVQKKSDFGGNGLIYS